MHARALLAEVAGSFMVQFVLIGTWLFLAGDLADKSMSVAIATGLALMVATTAFGHVSGGHFNPAVTLGLIAGGRFDIAHAPGFIVAQVIGATLATALFFVVLATPLTSSSVTGGLSGLAALSNGFAIEQRQPLPAVLLFEAVAALILVMTFMGATASRSITTIAPLAIGAVFAVLYMVVIPISGGGLNPARSTAVAIFTGTTSLSQLWVFWLAPTVGAIIGGLLARFILNEAYEH